MLLNVRGETYEEKLQDAGLTTLKERRKRGDLVEALKTLNGLNVEMANWFVIDESNSTRPSTRLNLNVTEAGDNQQKSSITRTGKNQNPTSVVPFPKSLILE